MRAHRTTLLLLAALAFPVACGGEGAAAPAPATKPASTTASTPAPTPAATTPAAAPAGGRSLAQRKALGGRVYQQVCFACHQKNGEGMAGQFPPLAKSDYLMADIDRAIRGIIHGQQGEMVVNGKTWNGVMPPQNLNDEDIANVLTYVLNSWGNSHAMISPEHVAQVRAAGLAR